MSVQCPQSSRVSKERASQWGGVLVGPGRELEVQETVWGGSSTSPLEKEGVKGEGGERKRRKEGGRVEGGEVRREKGGRGEERRRKQHICSRIEGVEGSKNVP